MQRTYEVYECERKPQAKAHVYARFKYREHANWFCNQLKEMFGTDIIYVRSAERDL